MADQFGRMSEWLARQPDDDGVSAGGPPPESCLCCGRIGEPAVMDLRSPRYVCKVCKAASVRAWAQREDTYEQAGRRRDDTLPAS